MNPTLLAIAVPVLIFIGGCAVILRRKIRDDDVPLFREHTGRHTAEAVAVASLRALRPGSPQEPVQVAERVIEPVVVDDYPPREDQPPPDGYFLAAATVSGGQVTSVRVGVLPPLPAPPVRPALPAYVTDEIGDRTVDDWLESAFTRAMAREVAEMESRDG